jgi:hypothetical protein
MSMDPRELEAETAELLPGREALGKLSLSFTKSVDVTKNINVNVANVAASNHGEAANVYSPLATAATDAEQGITVSQ